MIPIVQFPLIVEQHAPWFDAVFASDEQRKHFREYVTGLIVGNEATITAINNLFLERNDQSALNKFLTQAVWAEQSLNRRRVEWELARLRRRPLSAKAGRLVIDDTLAHHTRCTMDGLAYLWDHSTKQYVWAHNVVTSYYVNRADQFPVDFRLWYQFQAKKERWRLEQTAQRLNSQPTLTGYHQSLVDLLTFHLRQQRYRPKTVLAADLLSDQGQPGRARKGIRAPFESTGQRCRAVADETLYHLVSWIAQRLEEGLPAPAIVQTLLA